MLLFEVSTHSVTLVTFFIKSHFSSCNKTFQFVRWLTWAAVFTLSRRSIFLIPWVLESEVRTSSGASGALGAPLSSLQQMRGSAGCEMAVVIAPRPRGLQPIHSPVSSLIEPAEIGDKHSYWTPPPITLLKVQSTIKTDSLVRRVLWVFSLCCL